VPKPRSLGRKLKFLLDLPLDQRDFPRSQRELAARLEKNETVLSKMINGTEDRAYTLELDRQLAEVFGFDREAYEWRDGSVEEFARYIRGDAPSQVALPELVSAEFNALSSNQGHGFLQGNVQFGRMICEGAELSLRFCKLLIESNSLIDTSVRRHSPNYDIRDAHDKNADRGAYEVWPASGEVLEGHLGGWIIGKLSQTVNYVIVEVRTSEADGFNWSMAETCAMDRQLVKARVMQFLRSEISFVGLPSAGNIVVLARLRVV
jgi:DNA-binding Lrp family transcriptional regulator